MIKGNELTNAKPVELVLRRKPDEKFFHEIVVGNKNALHKYKKQIEGISNV